MFAFVVYDLGLALIAFEIKVIVDHARKTTYACIAAHDRVVHVVSSQFSQGIQRPLISVELVGTLCPYL
jgi:hypothetical protein